VVSILEDNVPVEELIENKQLGIQVMSRKSVEQD
jgi:hypothetical protein